MMKNETKAMQSERQIWTTMIFRISVSRKAYNRDVL